MSTPKHTPGPWFVVGERNPGAPITSPSQRFQIRAKSDNPTHNTCIAETIEDHRDVDGFANAALIAAAPDLLYALRCLTAEINVSKLKVRKDFSLLNAHAYATKQIRKAEGTW